MEQISDETLKKLCDLASRATRDNLVNAGAASYEDFYCGNEDDAFAAGYGDGQIDLAREILKDVERELPEVKMEE